ncbi:unnamed protein product [Linum tenue]|uniref:Uncharacterized protein n=1 Tax=Linum tenue TaxID=586396 RepID=A0AAV0RIF7_9ROSI|nr:unnamed protein product [Linum tenue]
MPCSIRGKFGSEYSDQSGNQRSYSRAPNGLVQRLSESSSPGGLHDDLSFLHGKGSQQ